MKHFDFRANNDSQFRCPALVVFPKLFCFFFPKESSLVEQSVSMRCCVFDKCQSKRCFCSFCNHANNKLLTQFLHFILTTNAMTWANFVFLGYKHFLQMFIYQRCLSACGQIGAVLENEVRKIFCCSCKSCLSILLMFLSSFDKFSIAFGEVGPSNGTIWNHTSKKRVILVIGLWKVFVGDLVLKTLFKT